MLDNAALLDMLGAFTGYPDELGKIIDLKPCGDERGSLVALEDYAVGFPVKRVYFIFNTAEGVSRGFHAHRDLKQVVIALTGSCRFDLEDKAGRKSVVLDDPTKGLVISSLVWREMHDFSPGCVLAVLSSENYKEADYIRDYDKFKRLVAPAR